jgi:hypothetical protein
MFRILATTAALALLTACGDGQPFDFGVVTPEPPGLTPEEIEEQAAIAKSIAGDLDGGTYSAAAGTMTVQITLDAQGPVSAEYTRNPALDVDGYIAFSQQDDPLDRIFIAMGARSFDNSVEGVLAMDGGQANRFLGGTTFRQIGTYSEPVPTSGLVSYAGNYVGLSNLSATSNLIGLPPLGPTDPAFLPSQASRVTGQVFINADFTDNAVNGFVVNRTNIDRNENLGDLALIITDISPDGRFLGTVELDGAPDEKIGDYGGTFGGLGASGVAGGIHLDSDYIDNVENEQEFGIFVLTQCGLTGDAAICDGVQPDF